MYFNRHSLASKNAVLLQFCLNRTYCTYKNSLETLSMGLGPWYNFFVDTLVQTRCGIVYRVSRGVKPKKYESSLTRDKCLYAIDDTV